MEHDNEPEVLLKEQTVVLRFSLHCREGCLREVKKFITERKGVTSVNIEEMDEMNALATVQGNFDVQKLVDSLRTKKSKRVEIVSLSSENPDTDDNVPPIGCSDKLFSCLRGFDGVEEIKIDRAIDKVIVKGEKADPIKILDRVQKRYSRNVELLHPKTKVVEKKEAEKKQLEPEVKIVTLKMYIHCEGCARDIKENLIRMEGVFTVELDMDKSQVRVKGVFDPPKLAEIITKRLGKHVEIVKEEAIKTEEKKENTKDEEENNCVVINYPPPPPNDQQPLQNDDYDHCQIFSDENVSSCFIM
ncbi:hypothetical protein EZV62_017336 [Acer yangbiense]|uniref:HMA domain-containing protein n=1 Tax=Acer yangbiense TaxID=1000413 RepID=A0A5C7HFW5_9ROSI|nr:hypothetical protein EZV62_017336 [Acer yangbiense]